MLKRKLKSKILSTLLRNSQTVTNFITSMALCIMLVISFPVQSVELSPIEDAKNYIAERIKENKHSKQKEAFAIILSVDDVALSYKDELAEFSTNLSPLIKAVVYLRGNGVANPEILALTQFANQFGVKVFFITQRPNEEKIMQVTQENLAKAGFQYEKIHFFPLGEETLSIEDYKRRHRIKLNEQGYQILLNIGHETQDIAGGFAEISMLTP